MEHHEDGIDYAPLPDNKKTEKDFKFKDTIKQVIIVRKDLHMRKGKLAAQCCHAAMKVFFDKMHKWSWGDPEDCQYCMWEIDCKQQGWEKRSKEEDPEVYPNSNPCKAYDTNLYKTFFSRDMTTWMEGAFTKVVVSVDSLEELLHLQKQADDAYLPNALIEDNGATEFKINCPECGGLSMGGHLDCSECNGTGKVSKPTITCLAIGPAKSEKIDKITGDLKLI